MDLSNYVLDTLYHDGEFVLSRGRAQGGTVPHPQSILVSMPNSQYPSPESVRMLEHEFALRTELDPRWAAQPLALAQYQGRAALILEDPQAEPLGRLLERLRTSQATDTVGATSPAMEVGLFLRLGIGLATALGEVHRRGIIHKNIKPAHILADAFTGCAWLTGFGIASRLPRERQAPAPPDTVAGTLAYMAPEQTGRMNRSIDTRSDLYALGVTFYQMVTGVLPFTATDPMEWVHCHLAQQPTPPNERRRHVPGPVTAIIMKLLAKTAEERYQTAVGLERDLRHCLDQFEVDGHIEDFALGRSDTPDRLLIPEKLYGRTREIEVLLSAFDRIDRGGPPELVVVSGYSGIGKSSVVNELQKVLVPPRGLFAAGKFDQYNRDTRTLVRSFRDLVRPLLGKGEAELAHWRGAIGRALGPNGQLMVDLIPELHLIVGDQPPVPELPAQDAKRRFHLVFRHFLDVFAQPEHPLALFFDDLQWLDAATLNLLQDLVTDPHIRHLLLIGAYRDNEVTATHRMMRTLASIRNAGANVREIRLTALTYEDLIQLIADSLYCDGGRAASLARLVLEKTEGNPFFVTQFLSTLVEEGLLTFNQGHWVWDLKRIQAHGYTDNVVDLMVSKLSRLSIRTQGVLQQLACLGNSSEFARLGMLRERSKADLDRDLEEALRAGLVLASGGFYRFLHDRIREAAYLLIPKSQRAQIHLRIGRLLADHLPPEKPDEAIFEIVNHLSRGSALITSRTDREQLAELSLIAGKRAKVATAYESALEYLVAAVDLLSDDEWKQRPDLIFAIELHRAECEFLTGTLARADARLTALASNATNPVDKAIVACLRIDLYTTLNWTDQAIDVCLDYLRLLGTQWSPHPTAEEARLEYARMWSLLEDREIEEIIDLPLMTEPEPVATLDVLARLLSAASFFDANLLSLLACRIVNLSLTHGISDASGYALVRVGTIAGPRFGNYNDGFRFGRAGYDLVTRRGLKRFQAGTYLGFGVFIMSWTHHLRMARDLIRQSFNAADGVGDVTQATYSWQNLIGNLLAAGDPLADVLREAERGMEYAKKASFGLVVDNISAQIALILTLRGSTVTFGSLNHAQFDEVQFERHLLGPRLAFVACWYWTRKLQARFLAGDYAAAVEASLKAQQLLWTSPGFIESVEAHFYGALSHAASCDAASPDQYRQHVEILAAHHKQLTEWTAFCAENFESRALLIGAEIARIEGRELDAEGLYEAAIKSARANGFLNIEALAHELAARFHVARGFETIANGYLREARLRYLRWGADGKVRQLETLHPFLREPASADATAATIAAPIGYLDLATVAKVSQAVSGEVVLDRLVDALMRLAIEHAGAERGLLLLSRGTDLQPEAEAITSADGIIIHRRDEPAAAFSDAIVQYSKRTHETVIIDDASIHPTFCRDPHVCERNARSILCLPLVDEAHLTGLLYLENNITTHAFTPNRVAVLKLLALQAAISLENSYLYRDLAEREARVRRLVDANIIGIYIIDLGGEILEANDAFLHMLGYEREDVVSGRLRWTDLTPPEWHGPDAQRIEQVRTTGSLQPFEKEYFHKDGSRVPVLVGAARIQENGDQAVVFAIDLTKRKHAEEEAKESERRFRDAHTKLAHASRVATMGQLTASIAHEVNQPIAATLTNAKTALRWLTCEPANVQRASQAIGRIVNEGRRAADIVDRIRAMVRKEPAREADLDVNETIFQVIGLIRSEISKNDVALHTSLANGLPLILGDQVQLQQVVLNLIMNAVEAMSGVAKDRRELLITTRIDAGCVLTAVRDSGPGLSQVDLERAFEAFYTTKSNGLGMGLSISRSIVEAHGGQLWATANEPKGTTFLFTVPVTSYTHS